MQDPPNYTDLSVAAGISVSYANEILSKKRTPSRALAIHIYRKTGWRHESIAELSEEDMATFERHEPFQPREAAA